MNIQQLKELAALVDEVGTLTIEAPKKDDYFYDKYEISSERGVYAECGDENDAKFIIAFTPKVAIELIDALEAAERERDEALTQRDKSGERFYKAVQYGAKLEAEIARRDAAAGDPYGYVHKSLYESNGSCGLSNDHEAHRVSSTHIPLYTTAPPAVLLQSDIDRIVPAIDPDGLDEAKHHIEHALYVDRERIRSELKELGAQPQKPVVLPALFNLKMAGDVKTRQYFKGSNDTIKQIAELLDAANVKYEVKK